MYFFVLILVAGVPQNKRFYPGNLILSGLDCLMLCLRISTIMYIEHFETFFGQGGVMLFISSYFEFVRLRNFLKSQEASFCLLGE